MAAKTEDKAQVEVASMTRNEKEGLLIQLRTLDTLSRMALAGGIGKTFEGNRDIYKEAGYKKDLSYQDFKDRFDRQDIAGRVVAAKPDATWRDEPEVLENEDDEETTFEAAWKVMVKERRLYHYFNRIDTLAGIGEYGILLLGISNGKLNQPLTLSENNRLIYLQPYSQAKAEIESWVEDEADERFGLPETYKITRSRREVRETTGATATNPAKRQEKDEKIVHWTRVIHVADDCLESDVFGTPRLKAVMNDLKELEQTIAASSEGFWKGSVPTHVWNKMPDADIDMTNAELNTEIQNLMMGLTRSIKVEGIDTKILAPDIVSPDAHVNTLLQLISGASTIPVRILTGSERGELASTQDRENWSDRIKERRKDFAEPVVLRAFIQRGIDFGFLPTPAEEFIVSWPDIVTLSEAEKAGIAKTKTETIAKYASTPGIEHILPVGHFRTSILGMGQEESDAIDDEVEEIIAEEEAEAAEAAKEFEEALPAPGAAPPSPVPAPVPV